MYVVSDEYTELMNDETSVLDVYVECEFGDGAIILDRDQIEYIELNERVNDNSNILTLGNACSHSVTIKLREPPVLQYKGLKCKPRTGIKLSDGTIEWVPLGTFWVDRAKTNDDYKTVIITAYDRMYRLNGAYTTSLVYPALIADVVAEFETLSGVKVVEPTEFPTLLIFNKVPGGKYSYREIAAHLAGCLGKNATFNRDGDLEFVYYTQTAVKAVEDLQYMNGFEKLADNALKVDFLITGQEGEIELENDGTDPGAIDWSVFDSLDPNDFPWLTFTYDAEALTASVRLTKGYESIPEDIKIPHSLAYNKAVYKVASVDEYGFDGSAAATITLPDTLVSIGDRAFQNCMNLTEFTIPESVTTLGKYLIYNSRNLATLYYNATDAVTPGGGYNVFGGYDYLKTVMIGEGVKTIPDDFLFGATGITHINIPDTVITIGNQAFSGCTMLGPSITIPEGVTSIGANAFYRCSSLKTIYYNAMTATVYGDGIFSGSGVENAIFGSEVIIVPAGLFRGCAYLKSVNIPGSVTSIGEWSFYGCKKLDNVKLPMSLRTIGKMAFSGCVALSELIFSEGIENIRNNAFEGCTSLVSLQLPDSLKTMETQAFLGCTSLVTVQIGKSASCAISSIAGTAFQRGTAITDITIYKATGSVANSPWGATNATINWVG